MMVDNGIEDNDPRHLKVNTSKVNFKFDLDEFKLEQNFYTEARESIIDYPTQKKDMKI